MHSLVKVTHTYSMFTVDTPPFFVNLDNSQNIFMVLWIIVSLENNMTHMTSVHSDQ